MAAIGSITVQAFNGRILNASRSVRSAGNFLASGDSFVLGGYKSPANTIRTVNTRTADAVSTLASTAACATLIASMLALEGTLVTVVDQWGQSRTNCFIQNVTATHSALAGAGGFVVDAEWVIVGGVLATGAAP